MLGLIKALFLFTLIWGFPQLISNEKELIERVIIWNVGQGSWATYTNARSCVHFDMGGEFFPQKIYKFCQRKKNYLVISHFDKDHINFIKKFSQNTDLCWLNPRPHTKKVHFSIPHCKSFDSQKILSSFQNQTDFQVIAPTHYSKNENDNSYVTQFSDWIFPGDSPKNTESDWLSQIQNLSVHYLVLSHHGSKTASSDLLFQRLKNLKMIFASARRKKYNHPHPEVIKRIKSYSLPLIQTEIWGNIFLELH